MKFSKDVERFRRARHNVGTVNTLLYLWKTKFYQCFYRQVQGPKVGRLYAKKLFHPVLFRYGSSDINVFNQIFMIEEYSPLSKFEDVEWVIDCGANVGYSSAFFLSLFPRARVIAIEPDDRNYKLLKQNLAPYGERAITINSAIWPRTAGLKVVKGQFLDGREWATTVRECAGNEQPDIEALDINSVIEQHGCEQVDILKVDIEGSERYVFCENYTEWLNKVRAIAIELHGPECKEVFFRALQSFPFKFSRSHELVLAERILAS